MRGNLPKAGYLPDISGVFQRWRQHYLEGLEARPNPNWSQVSLGLNNMNGSLDEDYRLSISDRDWETRADGYIVWDCQNCTTPQEKIINKGEDKEYKKFVDMPTRSKRSDIRIYEEKCNSIIKLLTGVKTRKMWICPKCNNIASIASVKATLLKYPEPHYRDCIYSEPVQPLTGLQTRRGSYPQQMKVWAKHFSHELEHKLALYRLEYIRQHDEDMEFMYKDKGDG